MLQADLSTEINCTAQEARSNADSSARRMALQSLDDGPMASQLRAVQPERYPSNKYVVYVSPDENHATLLDLAPKFVNRFGHWVVANGREWKADGSSGIRHVHPAIRHLDLETV
jgi:hypothetical protein